MMLIPFLLPRKVPHSSFRSPLKPFKPKMTMFYKDLF